ncbi:lysostaphin resistance A-like protein [Arenimonas sp.]|uniref:CPBP family intramembrane glutamic endopeptidase n=1 Tax=Arenimonas sp. TaxID=1872635 RepID=UPI0039E4574A
MIDATAATPVWLRILRNPISRILLFSLLAFGLYALMYRLLPPPKMTMSELVRMDGAELWRYSLRSLVPIALAYWLMVRVIEGRKVSELSPRKLPLAGIGWLVGMGLMLAAAALLAAFGAYRVHGMNESVELLAPLVVLGLLPGITEEIIVRGVLFRVVEDGLGSWAALVLSAAIFGGMHLANPNATTWSSIAIAVEAGLLLGFAYAWTRSLWFCIGLHAAWNFTQGPLLGIPVSGIEQRGWLDATLSGPTWLSGGEFGAEASVLTVVLCTSLARLVRVARASQRSPPSAVLGSHRCHARTPRSRTIGPARKQGRLECRLGPVQAV